MLLKGLLIGLMFGVPIGAVGAITIRRTIAAGPVVGFVSGLGCSFADMIYSLVSVFSLTVISDFLLKYQYPISVFGGILIIAVGIASAMKPHKQTDSDKHISRLAGIFMSSFGIAITNPATIITFITAFSIFNIGHINSISDGAALVLGILLGTCIWWLAISMVFGIIRDRIDEKQTAAANKILGITTALFGAAITIRAIILNLQ